MELTRLVSGNESNRTETKPKQDPATPTNFQYLLKQLVGCHKCVNIQKGKLRVHIERTTHSVRRIYSTIFVYLPSFSWRDKHKQSFPRSFRNFSLFTAE